VTLGLQLRLDLNQLPKFRAEDLVESRSNAQAVAQVRAWPHWHGGCLALIGPEGCGKSHLAKIWQDQTRAHLLRTDRQTDLSSLSGQPVLIDGLDGQFSDETLFHLINMAGLAGGGLLITARTLPALWAVQLPDLGSRLKALPTVQIEEPDDLVLEGVLRQFFQQHNIRPADDLLPYLLKRIERSVPAARNLVMQLDAMADTEGKPVSKALARQFFEIFDQTTDLFA
jgi:chromosomal replication initiation ATPase DnaA